MVDAAADAPGVDATVTCYGHAPYAVCLDVVPMETVTIGGTVDTDGCKSGSTSGVVLAVDGTDACVLAGVQVSVIASSVVSGSHPLVLVGDSDITITGGSTLDVASSLALGHEGAGADACQAGMAGASSTDGGAGGSLQGAGGAAFADPAFHGGCAGGSGGGGAPGGDGGGAVYLVTAGSGTIQVTGAINASGAGGTGGQAARGGGGGGAGGFVLIDGGTVTLGTVIAIGGGGGAGGDDMSAGVPGGDATPLDAQAPGGSSSARCRRRPRRRQRRRDRRRWCGRAVQHRWRWRRRRLHRGARGEPGDVHHVFPDGGLIRSRPGGRSRRCRRSDASSASR